VSHRGHMILVRPDIDGQPRERFVATRMQVVIDCADPARLAEFWAQALGYKLQDPPGGFDSWPAFLTSVGVPESEWNSASAVVDPNGAGPRIYLQQVPEPKAGKNRLHLDLNVGGGHDVPIEARKDKLAESVERLSNLGASLVETREQRGEFWIVMQDPEGNEFCLQ
jgi:catechol 2,3-dioxygenase-like lactoylglutathione lyase family enzyme